MAKPVSIIVGVGPGNGAAFARRFASEGYAVALLARNTDFTSELAATLPDARAYACDVTDAKAIAETFDSIRRDLGDAETLIYNAGSGAWASVEETSPEDFEKAWRVNALGALLTAQQVIPPMKKAAGGNIILVGATASLRGGANFTAFASAKAALRSLAQSMARHLWRNRIHVAHIVIDGVIDLPRMRATMPDKPDSFFLNPDDIAETIFRLTQQNLSAWSFEIDVRPYGAKW